MKQVFEAIKHHSVTRPYNIAFEDDINQISWSDLATRVECLACQLDAVEGTIGIGLAGGIEGAEHHAQFAGVGLLEEGVELFDQARHRCLLVH